MGRRVHREYGLPNANQIFLMLVIGGLWLLTLLRPHWLDFSSSIHGGLWGIVDEDSNVTQTSWTAYCETFTIHTNATATTMPATLDHARVLCEHEGGVLLPEVVRSLLATSVSLVFLALLCAMYLHLGRPTRPQVFVLGMVPFATILSASVLGIAAVWLWEARLGSMDHGDCYGCAWAACILALVTSISMLTSWRWPGLCSVPSERQAAVPGSARFRPRRADTEPSANGTDAPAEHSQPEPAGSFRQMP
ncbi:TPA: hypothetical protein N0F65_006798 [Lagenidium giganteum]|uniref:Uncharacterized protein n=1 Tax=Lagenidium giganteum TaxID=4803 RepID=A0AAV2ZE07_9STRA|nr:TPA: hypothetical protein N0F65_006798 [Lagenidium giganteum]